MKNFLLVSCFILCSCLSKEKNLPLPDSLSSSSIFSSSSSEPSIHDCPPEDIVEFPVSYRSPGEDGPIVFGCSKLLELSVKELSFGKQGGVRCVTGSSSFSGVGASSFEKFCRSENVDVWISDSVGNSLGSRRRFKKLTCLWFTITALDVEKLLSRTLHVSVDTTWYERDTDVGVSTFGKCRNSFKIIQSKE